MTGSRHAQLNDKGWLHQKYLVEKHSMYEIAKMLGCSQSIIWDACKRLDIRTRTISEAQRGELNRFYGKHHTKKAKLKQGAAHVGNTYRSGMKHSEKTKEDMSATRARLTPTQRRINNAMRTAVRLALRGTKGGRGWESLVGYTSQDLMKTLEGDFQNGMTWKNYGMWHIDHIIPLARFHYDSPENPEFKKAWALNNLQPLWANENRLKSDKFMFF